MKAWYVVCTKPRKESIAEVNLQRQDFETYLPWIRRAARRKDKWVDVIEPLFPRYLFLRLDLGQQSVAPIRSTVGVTSLVTFGHRLTPVPDAAISTLRQSEDSQSGLHRPPGHGFQKGDAVSIISGPFEGLCGIFEQSSGAQRVAILLDILGKSSRVVLDRYSVAPIPPKDTYCST